MQYIPVHIIQALVLSTGIDNISPDAVLELIKLYVRICLRTVVQVRKIVKKRHGKRITYLDILKTLKVKLQEPQRASKSHRPEQCNIYKTFENQQEYFTYLRTLPKSNCVILSPPRFVAMFEALFDFKNKKLEITSEAMAKIHKSTERLFVNIIQNIGEKMVKFGGGDTLTKQIVDITVDIYQDVKSVKLSKIPRSWYKHWLSDGDEYSDQDRLNLLGGTGVSPAVKASPEELQIIPDLGTFALNGASTPTVAKVDVMADLNSVANQVVLVTQPLVEKVSEFVNSLPDPRTVLQQLGPSDPISKQPSEEELQQVIQRKLDLTSEVSQRLQARLEIAESSQKECENKLSLANLQLKNLGENLDQCSKQLSGLQQKKDTGISLRQDIKGDAIELQKTIDSLKKQLEENDKQKNKNEKNLEENQVTIKKITLDSKTNYQDLKDKTTKLEVELKASKDIVKALRSDLDKLQRQIDSKSSDQGLVKEVKNLRSELEKNRNQGQILKTQLAELGVQKKRLQDEILQVKKDSKNLNFNQNELDASIEKGKSLKTQISTLQTELVGKISQIKRCDQINKKLENSEKDLKLAKTKLEEKIKEILLTLATEKQQREECTKSIVSLQNKTKGCSLLQAKIEDLQEELVTANQDAREKEKDLQNKISNVENNLKECGDSRIVLQAEIEEFQKRLKIYNLQVKEPVAEVKKSEETPVELPIEPPVEIPVEIPIEEPIQEPIEPPVEIPVEIPIEEPVEEPIEEPVEEPIEEPVELPIEEPIQEPIEPPVEEPIQEPIEEPIQEPIEPPVEEPIQEPVEEPVETPIEEPVELPIEEPVELPIEEPVETAIEEHIQEPVETPIEEPVEESVEEPIEESIEQSVISEPSLEQSVSESPIETGIELTNLDQVPVCHDCNSSKNTSRDNDTLRCYFLLSSLGLIDESQENQTVTLKQKYAKYLDENKAQTPLAQVVLKVKDCVDNYNYNQDTIATLESRLKPDEEQFLRQQALEKKDELQQLFDKK
jgi:hypothetical protein